MTDHQSPTDVVLRLFGGIEATAAACGMKPKSPYVWRRAVKGRAAGDLPSANIMRKLLAHARAHGIPLTPEHLIFGASEKELALLVAFAARRDAQSSEQVAA
jgi:hypothetical protein